MRILVNNEEIDFTLENEKTLGDVMTEIEKWIQESGFNITSLKANGKTLPLQDKNTWYGIGINDIDTLEMTASHISQLRAENLETAYQYLSLLQNALSRKDSKLFNELKVGLPFMIESLENNFLIDRKTTEGLDRIKRLKGEELISLDQNLSHEMENFIDDMKVSVKNAYNEILKPADSLKSLVEELVTSEREISEVSILLQSGRDREAMDKIVRFSDLTSRLFRILSSMDFSGIISIEELKIGGKSGKEFYRELNGILGELIEAFGIGDYVLIGDLLEYEIAPRLEMLITLAKEIQIS